MSELDQHPKVRQIAEHYKAILQLLGEDVEREGLQRTPMRAAKALWHATQGYREDADTVMSQAIFNHQGSRMVIVKDIEFYSLCEHHILPFFGHASIAYIPNGRILGLSKLARVVNVFAQRLQVQERMTAEIMESIDHTLHPQGVMVVCNAGHLCMKMRGVEKQDSMTTTTAYCGVFETDAQLRAEFLNSLRSIL